MELVALTAFFGCCVLACIRPTMSLVLVILMFPAEIVLQGVAPTLRSSSLGFIAVNAAIGATTLIAASRLLFREPAHFARLLHPVHLSVYALFGWSAITLLWSPGAEEGAKAIIEQLPYFFVVVVLAPLVIISVDDFATVTSALLVCLCVLCCTVLISPEFASKNFRLGIDLGFGFQSNPLALGELGGFGILIGALARRTNLGIWATLLRVIAVIAGSAVAILSGSRGQFFYALVIAVVFVPVAGPIKSLRNFVVTMIAIAFVCTIAYFLLGLLLGGASERRFSFEGLLYGSSSTETRINNVIALAGAWAVSPFAWVAGLGFYAYNGLFSDGLNIYSHVLFADMLFEEGIPGLVLMATFLIFVVSRAVDIVRQTAHRVVARTSATILVAMFAYQVLLVNKQGNLWGSTLFFLLGLLIVDLHRSVESQSGEEQDAGLDHDESSVAV